MSLPAAFTMEWKHEEETSKRSRVEVTTSTRRKAVKPKRKEDGEGKAGGGGDATADDGTVEEVGGMERLAFVDVLKNITVEIAELKEKLATTYGDLKDYILPAFAASAFEQFATTTEMIATYNGTVEAENYQATRRRPQSALKRNSKFWASRLRPKRRQYFRKIGSHKRKPTTQPNNKSDPWG